MCMKEIKIEHLAYIIKTAKKNNKPLPIFFLGSGASKTGNIPTAPEIAKRILEEYNESPFIRDLKEEEKIYSKLMGCLLPEERETLLKEYIKDAKINVTHIYLAQLFKEGFIDYVVTVNFDNLMLRALALYNIFPPTYDMAVLKNLTTTTFPPQSVIYLHGQNHGPWLLNTDDEMKRGESTIPRVLDSIKDRRPWIFIGYSGIDPIFNHIKKYERFDNGLYWVCFNQEYPIESVFNFLSTVNINASLIKGYDADSFMTKLNTELGISQPEIISSPFTALQNTLNEIVDIDNKKHFEGVKKRLEVSKEQVKNAIEIFEEGKPIKSSDINEDIQIDLLKKELTEYLINEKYSEINIDSLESKVIQYKNDSLYELLANLYNRIGANLAESIDSKKDNIRKIDILNDSIVFFKKAILYNNYHEVAYYNWGNALNHIAELKQSNERKEIYQLAIDKYNKAIDIYPNYDDAYTSIGNTLNKLASLTDGHEAEKYLLKSIEKYNKAIKINPKNDSAYFGWGISLHKIYDINPDIQKEKLLISATEKLEIANLINPNIELYYYNLAQTLGKISLLKEPIEKEKILNKAIENYIKAIQISPSNGNAYINYGYSLLNLAKLKDGSKKNELLQNAIACFKKALELGNTLAYNLACAYSLLNNISKAITYLDRSIQNKEVKIEYVLNDEDWQHLINHPDFINVIKKYKLPQ